MLPVVVCVTFGKDVYFRRPRLPCQLDAHRWCALLPAVDDDAHFDRVRARVAQARAKRPLRRIVGVRIHDFPSLLSQQRRATASIALWFLTTLGGVALPNIG